MSARKPLSNAKQIRQSIANLSRDPFKEILSDLINSLPNKAEIKDWARDNPDKLFHAISRITPLAGYQEKVVHGHNHLIAISLMSDSQLAQRLIEVQHSINDLLVDSADGINTINSNINVSRGTISPININKKPLVIDNDK
jgi:hypothetical protein